MKLSRSHVLPRCAGIAALLGGALALPGSSVARPDPTGHLPRAHAGRSHRIAKRTWLRGVTVTEYWPAPEAWFVGRKVAAPGIPGRHRIDWLYSASGVSMEGDGIGLDGRSYHLDNPGAGGWVTPTGRGSTPGARGWQGGTR